MMLTNTHANLIPAGIHPATIASVTVSHTEDTQYKTYTVLRIDFELKIEVGPGDTREGRKIYNVTSAGSRNSLVGEMKVLGLDVHNRDDLQAAIPALQNRPCTVEVRHVPVVYESGPALGEKFTFVKRLKREVINSRINF